jgi:hypothetical protein
MNELKHLRLEASSNVASLHNSETVNYGRRKPIELVASMLGRSVPTLYRWEQNPNPDRIIEYAYRYLAGYVFGWSGWQVNLKHNHIRLWESTTRFVSVPRQRIEAFDYSERIQQQMIRTLQKKIETLEAELEAIKT